MSSQYFDLAATYREMYQEHGASEVAPGDCSASPAEKITVEIMDSPSCRRLQDGAPLIAIIYGHTPMTVGRMFKAGLSQIGANVVSIGGFGGSRVGWPIERTHEDYLDVPDIIVERKMFYTASYIVGKIEEVWGRRPSMLLQIDGGTHVCNDMGGGDILFVSIATDPHMPSETYAHAASCSTHFYCMQTSYMHLFGDRAGYIPYGYDPEVHYMEPVKKVYDVACIGFQFAARAELGSSLAKLGLRVRFENGPVFDEYRKILNQSWICFNLSAADDLNMRVFETLACGTLLVSNVTTDMARFFREGVDYVSYRTPDEAIEKILYYLDNKDELAAIAESGHRAVQGHTYARRLLQIFSEIGFEIPATEARRQDPGCDGTCAFSPVAELSGYYRHVRSEILAAVPPEGRSILDVGCGAGMLGKALKEQERERKVTGIEINHEAFHYARMNLDEAFHAELESFDPPFRKGEFDCMVFADVLEHLKNPWRMARLYASFLRPGGTFIASIPNIRFLPFLCNLAENGSWKYQDEGLLDHTHLRFFTRREFLRLLDFAGIRCDSVSYLGTASCAHLRPATPERSIKCGNISLMEVSDADFAEMSAFQILFSGTYRPVDRSLQPWLPDAIDAEMDFADFARYCSTVDRLYKNACQLVREERGDHAILLLKRLLRLAPNHDAAHNDLGLLYYDMGELQKAVEHFATCSRLAPDNSEALKNLASLYVELGELVKGIEAYREIANLDPKNAESVVNLGNLNFLAGNREDARALYAQALAIDPQNSAASRGMAALGQ
jgi:2-polyprenyl-3-methyl-5-hydroxy-6-metoxy-1,4-benzoquinol methylase